MIREAVTSNILVGLCAACNVCEFMPEQEDERVLEYRYGSGPWSDRPLVLLIDDYQRGDLEDYWMKETELFGEVRVSSCSTIRCKYTYLSDEDKSKAISRCSVWTGSIAEDRKLIVTTIAGLKQLKIEGEYEEGEILKSNRLGMVLVIPPLLTVGSMSLERYKNKIQRLLRSLKLI